MAITVSYDKESKEIHIRIPFDEAAIPDLPYSASGKTRLVATTNGNVPVDCLPSEMRLGLNMFWRLPPEQRRKD